MVDKLNDIQYWDVEHNTGYTRTFNPNIDSTFLLYLSSKLNMFDIDLSHVLIIGCGSQVELQKFIFQQSDLKDTKVVATDYSSKAIQISESKFSNENIVYINVDTYDLLDYLTPTFTAIFNINVILNHEDLNQIDILSKLLVEGGKIVSLIPSTFTMLDIMYEYYKQSNISIPYNKIDINFGTTVVETYNKFGTNGLHIDLFDIYLFNTPKHLAQIKKIYGIDFPIWENFIIASKESSKISPTLNQSMKGDYIKT